MSKGDLSNCTFLIPLRIESDDRMRNITTIVAYLLTNFNTKIIIKEYDSQSVFQQYVIPMLKCGLNEDELNNITHIFEKTEEYIFHRTRLINDMVLQSTTPVVVNYDSDILLPIESYFLSVELITSGQYKCVYPYGYGNWQYQVRTNDSEVTDFLNSESDFSIFKNKNEWDAKYGFCQFFDREEYIRLGIENEKFISYGYEDDERYYRFSKLSKLGRIDNYVYHLEHKRTSNSWFSNPYIEDNKNLWEKIQKFSDNELLQYYTK
ncbi:MAG: hypothetical protein EBU90_15225 [Proteobacteria bacterium]|nr:hypothetical protein [Pseudomonadota bacterium]